MGALRGERRAAKRILVVDDERTIRELIATALEEAGYRTLTASNGADAWACMRRNVPDAIVLDLMMPVMNATQLIELMRQSTRLAHVPVLVISAAYDACGEAQRLGVSACLTKPFQLEELVEQVARLVEPGVLHAGLVRSVQQGDGIRVLV